MSNNMKAERKDAAFGQTTDPGDRKSECESRLLNDLSPPDLDLCEAGLQRGYGAKSVCYRPDHAKELPRIRTEIHGRRMAMSDWKRVDRIRQDLEFGGLDDACRNTIARNWCWHFIKWRAATG